MRRTRRGQVTLEVGVVLVAAIIALLGMRNLVRDALIGRWKEAGDTFGYGLQYEPGCTQEADWGATVGTSTSCNAVMPPQCGQTATGTDGCGHPCSVSSPPCCVVTSCNAVMPPQCGQTATGTNNCGGPCSVSSPPCPGPGPPNPLNGTWTFSVQCPGGHTWNCTFKGDGSGTMQTGCGRDDGKRVVDSTASITPPGPFSSYYWITSPYAIFGDGCGDNCYVSGLVYPPDMTHMTDGSYYCSKMGAVKPLTATITY